MEVEVVKSEKNDMEIKVDNLTVAEALRVKLNEQGVDFAAWRREHPSKPAILKVKTSGKTAKKAISDAIVAIGKDCDKVLAGLKKK
jgi:DNA-directed RNA polymerase subunit L